MHTIKITPNLLFDISVQAANLSDCRIESKLFLPELECSSAHLSAKLQCSEIISTAEIIGTVAW